MYHFFSAIIANLAPVLYKKINFQMFPVAVQIRQCPIYTVIIGKEIAPRAAGYLVWIPL